VEQVPLRVEVLLRGLDARRAPGRRARASGSGSPPSLTARRRRWSSPPENARLANPV